MAGISITKIGPNTAQGGPFMPINGQQFDYVVTIINNGAQTLINTNVTDTVDPDFFGSNVIFNNVTTTRGTATIQNAPSGPIIEWVIDVLPAFQSATMIINAISAEFIRPVANNVALARLADGRFFQASFEIFFQPPGPLPTPTLTPPIPSPTPNLPRCHKRCYTCNKCNCKHCSYCNKYDKCYCKY